MDNIVALENALSWGPSVLRDCLQERMDGSGVFLLVLLVGITIRPVSAVWHHGSKTGVSHTLCPSRLCSEGLVTERGRPRRPGVLGWGHGSNVTNVPRMSPGLMES